MIFRDEECDAANLYWKILLAVKQFEDSFDVMKFSDTSRREIIVKWKAPAEGWFKYNVDGSSKCSGASATCGGEIRNIDGDWVSGFSMKLNCQDSLSAAIELVTNGCSVSHPLAHLVESIRGALNKSWSVVQRSCFREENEVAHVLASAAHGGDFAVNVFDEPLKEVRELLRKDKLSIGRARAVPLGV